MTKTIKKSEETVIEFNADKYDKELAPMVTKSSKIRFLLSKGFTRSQVAKKLNIIYQHVRNVEITPIKKQK